MASRNTYRPPRSSTNRPGDRSALGWLGHDMRGAGVLATARKHLQIQHAVAAVLPPALGALCVVAKLENQHLQLAVPGPAHAAKLRQMAPRIAQTPDRSRLERKRNQRPGASRHAAAGTKSATPAQAGPAPGLDCPGCLRDAASGLAPRPLADAVARLLKHHKNR